MISKRATQSLLQGDQKIGEKICPNLEKISQNSCQAKNCQHINIKAQFESQRHLHQPTFEPLKFLEQTML
jgi:hypothetical protein